MKALLAHIILCIFLFQTTGSLWVLVNFYANQDYIAKNECINRFDKIPVCYGKCVLEKRLSDSEDKQQKLPNTVKEKEIQSPFTQPEYVTIPASPIYWKKTHSLSPPVNTIAKKLPRSIFQPPEAV